MNISSRNLVIGGVVLLVVALPFLVRAFVFETCHLPASSQDDTVRSGDYFLVNKLVLGIHVPFTDKRIFRMRSLKRGDVIVFNYPHDPDKVFVKRIIGLPGEEVKVVEKKVYINGKPYVHPKEAHLENDLIPANQNPRDSIEPRIVPEDSYFVMGDNRDRSYDSRFWGSVKDRHLRGLAVMTIWSWDDKKGEVRWSRIGRPIK